MASPITVQPGYYPGGPQQPGGYPGGPQQPGGYPGGPQQPGGYPGGPQQPVGYYPGGPQQPGYYPGGPQQPVGYPPYPPPTQGGPGPNNQFGAQPMAMMPPTSQPPPGCPPGLEYLVHVDQLLVHQQIELLEVITGWETENKYKVRNTLGQDVYFAAERSNCCARQYLGPSRPFEMTITDNMQREVIHLVRPCRCMSCLCFCCLQKIEVQSPPGTVIGYVKQDCSFVYPSFSILNAEEETVLKIRGPCFTCRACQAEFEVLSSDGVQNVGKISKQWSGLAKEIFTDADNFGIQFPMDLDVKMKATTLAACFLIDFMYFEDNGNRNHHHHH